MNELHVTCEVKNLKKGRAQWQIHADIRVRSARYCRSLTLFICLDKGLSTSVCFFAAYSSFTFVCPLFALFTSTVVLTLSFATSLDRIVREIIVSFSTVSRALYVQI